MGAAGDGASVLSFSGDCGRIQASRQESSIDALQNLCGTGGWCNCEFIFFLVNFVSEFCSAPFGNLVSAAAEDGGVARQLIFAWPAARAPGQEEQVRKLPIDSIVFH